ncbi:hypothetical protein PROFUN_06741 [Planoprotostelium fungivorum]|uniref:Uncharacterized protein n=1 Tax=Planoprotostelium fungivorum TaxID=1890364 RepID=A0A2P6NNH8_9EUKA|nr:hypothetical protein PROFUN_06741 [Planoprotostelium fungivorum]
MAGDRFLEHCTTLENQLHEKSHRLRSRRRLHEDSSTTSQVDERRLQELMDNFDRETKDHMENWRDTLHGTTEILTNGLADVAEVREIAEEWWEQKWRIRGSDGDRYEQPGRMVVPWYEVKGKDFRGTLDKCMSICTEINQKEEANYKRRWSSGRISACHAGDPGSIPGRRTSSTMFFQRSVDVQYVRMKMQQMSSVSVGVTFAYNITCKLEAKEAIPGFEPGFQGSEPRVLTATLYGLGVGRIMTHLLQI